MSFEADYQAFQNLRINVKKKKVAFDINFKDWCDLWTGHSRGGTMQLQRVVKELGYVAGNLIVAEKPKTY